MDESMNAEQCAAFLHIHENTLMEKIATGEIPAAKIGKCWVFLKGDIVDYLHRQIKASTAERKARASVDQRLNAAEDRGQESIAPTLHRRSAAKRRIPPVLPDLPSPQFVREFART